GLDDWFSPRLEVMAMGWPRAPRICRQVATASAQKVGSNVGAAVYAGDAGVARAREDRVAVTADAVYAQLLSDGLGCKSIEHGPDVARFAGSDHRRSRGRISAGRARRWKVKLALARALAVGRASGPELRSLMARSAWCATPRRRSLSLPRVSYKFLERAGDERIPPWASVRRELGWTVALLPLAWERWRFAVADAAQALASALGAAGARPEASARAALASGCERIIGDLDPWQLRAMGWRLRAEAITSTGEAATVVAAQRALGSPEGCHLRRVNVGDSAAGESCPQGAAGHGRGARVVPAGPPGARRSGSAAMPEFLSELDQRLELHGLSARPRPSAPLDAGAPGLLDLGVTEWVTEQYLEGFDHWRGANPMAAPAAARQALKARRNLTLAARRLPLPAEVVFAIAVELMAANRWDMAMCATLPLAFLTRPGNWET
ncbi:unnamed protein product, partial [Prorocentrum cordatum]